MMNTYCTDGRIDNGYIRELRILRNKRRRAAIVRRQITISVLIATVLVFIFAFMISSFMSDAQSDTFEPQFKYYKTVTVHADDTIWNIANENYSSSEYSDISDYISEICSINRIGNADAIRAGEALIVPYYSSEYK